jgi:DNA-binding transcriptional LysR family regulator
MELFSTMDRLHLMTVFVAVAEAQSFAAAARRLAMSPPAVTRAVATLEARLGVKLLTRTTRLVRVTDAGQRYLESARRIIAEADEADDAAAGVNAAPRGQLAITAPVLFGRLFIIPGVVDYLGRYPDVAVSALFVDRVVNLVEEGLDVGVRIGELPDSTMQAIGVGRVRRVVCASPAYLEAHGVPRAPADLAGHTIISASPVSPLVEWRFARDRAAPLRKGRAAGKRAAALAGPESVRGSLAVKVSPRLTVTSNDAAIDAALQGFGVTRLLSYQVAAHVAAGRLAIVLADHELPPVPIHVLHREGRQASAKVRSFVDLLVARLRADPALR